MLYITYRSAAHIVYVTYNMSGRSVLGDTSHCIPNTDRTRILYMTYETSMCIRSCSTKILKIKLHLAEKIGVKTRANQEDFVSKIQPPSRTMISIVFSSLIINEFYKFKYTLYTF